MAKEDDVTEGGSERENAATRRARAVGIDGIQPMSAADIGKAVADAMERQRLAPATPQKPLSEVVRASVRAGYEDIKVNDERGRRVMVQPKSITFKASETADGKETTVSHGRPVRLKREAFQRYYGEGLVEIAQ